MHAVNHLGKLLMEVTVLRVGENELFIAETR